MFDYKKISSDLIKHLPERTRDVISRRFGLGSDTASDFSASGRVRKESLESIGSGYGVTRERVRQIEKDGILKVKEKAGKYGKIFQELEKKMDEFGGLKREDLYLASLGEEKMTNHVFFLLTLSDSLFRFPENKEFYSFWVKDPAHFDYIQEVVNSIHNVLEEKKEPLSPELCGGYLPASATPKINSYIEISKNIHQSSEGLLGLKDWPEVNPRSVRDKAYLTLKNSEKPLHFTEVAQLIGGALPQTVHNELIKDDKFVLVGRGMYALKEWGYMPGEVKDVISNILKNSKEPLSKEEIVDQVLKQRVVKENTVLQNLSNRGRFLRTSDGKYIIKEG